MSRQQYKKKMRWVVWKQSVLKQVSDQLSNAVIGQVREGGA